MDTKHHTKLTAHERDLIAVWKGGGVSLRKMARRLGRSPSTICDEIKRNSFQGRDEKYYVAIHAQAKTEKRNQEARKRHPLKDPVTYAYVFEKLRDGWSPEQIAGRLRKEYGRTIICHETIYQFIYADHKRTQELKLWEYLPWKRTKRKKRHGRKVHRSHIPDRVSIHLRPAQVETRTEIGHWEGDTLEGRRKQDGIRVEIERVMRITRAIKVKRITGEETIKAQKMIFSHLPTYLRKTTTMDNGRENHLHTQLKSLKMRIYFCDPYSAWQKGTVEQTIGLLRRYLPKGTDLTTLTQEELDDIVEELNNRPRKVLNYNTPNEVLRSYLGVRIQS